MGKEKHRATQSPRHKQPQLLFRQLHGCFIAATARSRYCRPGALTGFDEAHDRFGISVAARWAFGVEHLLQDVDTMRLTANVEVHGVIRVPDGLGIEVSPTPKYFVTQMSSQEDLRRLNGATPRTSPPHVIEVEHLALSMSVEERLSVLVAESPVVDAVGKRQNARSKPVAAQVTRLPNVCTDDGVESPEQCAPLETAASVASPVGTHEMLGLHDALCIVVAFFVQDLCKIELQDVLVIVQLEPENPRVLGACVRDEKRWTLAV